MDLSNKEESKYWFQQARDVDDAQLRKIALKACDHYHSLALKQEKISLSRTKPGYGFRPLLGFFCVIALIVLWCLLAFAKAFSVGTLLSAGSILIVLMIVGSAFASHSSGRLSDDSLVRLVQVAIQRISASGSLPSITASEENTASKQENTASHTPANHEHTIDPPKIEF